MARLEAIMKRCRTRGGDCPCGSKCKAESLLMEQREALDTEMSRLKREIDQVDRDLKWVRHVPCTVRETWTQPAKPDGGNYRLAVHHTGDGWWPHWYDPDAQVDCLELDDDHQWPFVEELAYGEDWEAIGFEVV